MNKNLDNIRHLKSKKDFPYLSLEKGEYVELVITRSKYALLSIWFSAILVALLLTIVAIFLSKSQPNGTLLPGFSAGPAIGIILPFVYIFIFLIAIVATKVHNGNKLFITNKRAIQMLKTGLFDHSTNVVELSRIEDVSYKQSGLIESIFHYGTIRMSTVGDETTYTFPYVDTPTDELQTISHLVHIQKGEKDDS